MLNEARIAEMAKRMVKAAPGLRGAKADKQKEVEKNIKTVLDGIEYINSFADEDGQFSDNDRDKLKIHPMFKDFILPYGIYLNPNSMYSVNLMEVPEFKGNFDRFEFNNAMLEIQGYFRKDNADDFVKVGDIRKKLCYFDVLDRCAFNKGDNLYVHLSDDQPFIPYILEGNVAELKFYHKSYYNISLDELLEMYVDHLMM